MKSIRGSRGFTMTEMMATIAIIGIVSALAFVSISQYQRAAYQNEMDETAKQIYIAAQNHLTVAGSLGTLPTSGNGGAAAKKTQGTADTATDEGAQEGSGIYYYVMPADSASLNNRKSMLSVMLPQGSIDETVRGDGSYIIRYQCNDSAAKVLDVFYANKRGDRFLQSGYSYTFTDADFAALFAQGASYRDAGDAGKEARANYDGAIIGYYGGADVADAKKTLPTPNLEVRNAEELTARLVNPHEFDAGVTFEFYAVGDTSGAISKPIVARASDVVVQDGKSVISAAFDSITRRGAHFAELKSTNDSTFIPGENIKIQVFALDTASTKVSRSAKRTTNSLFASVSTTNVSDLLAIFRGLFEGGPLSTQASTGARPVAKIANIRHLENMSNAVSGYASSALGDKAPASYEQTRNLSWPDFCKAVVGLEPDASGQMPADNADSRAVQIIPMAGEPSSAHTFMPIDWAQGALEYKGNALKIEGVEVNASGNAGVFGTLADGDISNLELVNFSVVSTGGDAGALAGAASNTTITNVLARHETTSDGSGVSAGVHAGGLVGSMTGGSVENAAAALYVSGTASAGGLVGHLEGATVSYSYAGGHTQDGKQVDAEGNPVGLTNVISESGAAGGLVGSLGTGSPVSSCYSTCSVRGASTGRLIGTGDAAAGQNCYGVGAAGSEAWQITDLSGAALSAQSYDTLVSGSGKPAVPYDQTLMVEYVGTYPFKTIDELRGSDSQDGATMLTKHLKAHYGDWPALVTVAVNP